MIPIGIYSNITTKRKPQQTTAKQRKKPESEDNIMYYVWLCYQVRKQQGRILLNRSAKKMSVTLLTYLSIQLPFSLAGPKIMLRDRSPVVRLLRDFKLLWSVTGTPPIYTALIRNSTVLVNITKEEPFTVDEEGNYTCLATSKYGMDRKEFSVIFTGENLY